LTSPSDPEHRCSIVTGVAGFCLTRLAGAEGSETWTVGLPPGRYDFVCDVPFHIGAGIVGTLVVTG
jgi:plastocyanin